MRAIFFFDSMLTPKIITLVYWLILLLVVISGVRLIVSGSGLVSILGGGVAIIGGAVFARIWCELMIVLFKIHENLKKVAEK